MSRFADASTTVEVDLGPCECPGGPHAKDFALIRADLSGAECAILLGLGDLDQEETAEAVAPFIVSWNLLGSDGKEWPPSPEALFALKGPTSEAIGKAIGEVVVKSIGPLPNPSGAPSAASSQASASPTPTKHPTPGT